MAKGEKHKPAEQQLPPQPQQQQQQQQQLPHIKLAHKKLRPQVVNDHMLLVPGVLTAPEAQRLIDAAEAYGFEHQGSRGAAFGEAFRDNHRISMQDQGLADQLWSVAGLERVMAGVEVDGLVPVSLNPHIRFYRYAQGQKFGKHIDDSVEVAPGRVTGYTLLVYMSGMPQQGVIDVTPAKPSSSSGSSQPGGGGGSKSKRQKQAAAGAAGASRQPAAAPINTKALQELVGGETVFYGARGRAVASVRPAAGLALLHLHGEDKCLEHEANEVQQGVKYVLRSDVVFAAPGAAAS